MELTVDSKDRLDRFLARMLPEHSRSKLVKMIDAGDVLVDGSTYRSSHIVEAGSTVTLPEPADAEVHDLSPADIPLEIIFEDDDLLIVNKPRGLAAHPAASLKEPSLVNALIGRNTELSQAGGAFRPGIVHRLDKETTGLMVVAKNDQAHVALAKQMEEKTAERRYAAVVARELEKERFVINAPMARHKHNRLLMTVDPNGKPAVTHIKKLMRLDQGTLVVCRLETGRTHQIRVHLSAVGLPVLGDTLYAPKPYSAGDLQLHAAYLAITHPTDGKRMEFYAAPDTSFYGHGHLSLDDFEPF